MAFIPSVESAQKFINQSRVLYQDALAEVAIAEQKLQAAVDSGQVKPGTQEFLDLRNQTVNRAKSQAETFKIQYDQDLANLDLAREAAAQSNATGPNTGNNNFVSPAVNPQVPSQPPIVGAGQIDPAPDNVAADTVPQGFTQEEGVSLISEPEGTEADPTAQPPVGEDDLVLLNNGQNLGVPDEDGFVQSSTGLNVLPEDIEPGMPEGYLTEFSPEGDRVLNPEEATVAQEQASAEFSTRQQARQQQAIASQRRQVNNADWRVRLRLAPQSKYLYNAPQPGILQPLTVTDGVIFPYTPTITTNYRANYTPYDLTHSNYKGYWYSSSAVEPITVTGTFTAQDTAEANYLLAVIHFFRSATKMFYGQDAERGSPPPVCYLSGLGEYQFNEHSCVIQNFTYTLPADVDYIRAGSPGNTGVNLTTRRDRQNVATNGIFGSLNRLAAAFLTKGAIPGPPAPPTLGLNRPTYVPTKMEISITLLPVQSRQQVSKQFSVKEFANGNLLRGGFW